MQHDVSFQLTSPTTRFDRNELIGMVILGIGLLAWLVAVFGIGFGNAAVTFWIGLGGIALGSAIYFRRYLKKPAGINNDGTWFHRSMQGMKSMLGWIIRNRWDIPVQ